MTLDPKSSDFKRIIWELISTQPRSFPGIIKATRNREALDFLRALPVGNTLNEQILIFCSGIDAPPKCKMCNNRVQLKDNCISKGWETFCCKSCKTKYGNTIRNIDQAYLKKFRERYSKTWHANERNKDVVEQQDITRRQNCLVKYGVEHTWQLPEIQRKCHNNATKSGHSYKSWKSPVTGKIFRCRGFEPLAIELLEMDGLDFIANDFETPTIQYSFNGKTSNYFPDIFVPAQNKIIEVKSDYWLWRQYDKNKAIQSAALKLFDFEFWVFNSKHVLSCINIL